MDAGNMADWVGLAAKAAGGLAMAMAGWVWWTLNQKVSQTVSIAMREYVDEHKKEHVALEKRLAHGDVRFARMETTLEHLPTRDDLEEVRREAATAASESAAAVARIDQLSVQLTAMSEQLQMLVSHQLQASRS